MWPARPRSGTSRSGCCGRLNSCSAPSPASRRRRIRRVLRVRVADLVGEANTNAGADRRTPAELLAENDQLARLAAARGERPDGAGDAARLPRRGGGAARLWSVLPSAGQTAWPAWIRCFGWWPLPAASTAPAPAGCGRVDGPSDERLLIMAGNFTRAADTDQQLDVSRPSRIQRRGVG